MADTTPTLRDAATKALEALRECELFIRVIGLDSQPAAKVAESARATITALRAALAEQAAEQASAVQAVDALNTWRPVRLEFGVTMHRDHNPPSGGEWLKKDEVLAAVAGAAPAAEQAEPVAVPAGYALMRTPITEEMHVAAAKVLVRANGLDGTPQRMLDAMIAAAPPAPARQEWQPLTQSHVDYVLQYGGRCRECADWNGICPSSGLPCGGAEKAVQYVLRALNYGFKHGYITPAPAEGGAA